MAISLLFGRCPYRLSGCSICESVGLYPQLINLYVGNTTTFLILLQLPQQLLFVLNVAVDLILHFRQLPILFLELIPHVADDLRLVWQYLLFLFEYVLERGYFLLQP